MGYLGHAIRHKKCDILKYIVQGTIQGEKKRKAQTQLHEQLEQVD